MTGDWARGRTPPVPAEFLDLLDVPEPPSPGALTDAACAAMEGALSLPPADRDAAFHLLAADAYLTWACAVALESEGAGADFQGVLTSFLASFLEEPV